MRFISGNRVRAKNGQIGTVVDAFVGINLYGGPETEIITLKFDNAYMIVSMFAKAVDLILDSNNVLKEML